jgi:hypothetical protein
MGDAADDAREQMLKKIRDRLERQEGIVRMINHNGDEFFHVKDFSEYIKELAIMSKDVDGFYCLNLLAKHICEFEIIKEKYDADIRVCMQRMWLFDRNSDDQGK